MEQKNQQTKKSVGSIVLAVILGICVIALVASNGLLLFTMQRSDQIGHYTEKESDKQQEDTAEAENQEQESSISDSMSGFVAGGNSASDKEEESSKKDNGISNEDYILPDSDSKYYTNEDLKKLTREEVKLARNEIYARHGRKFAIDMNVKEYFEGKDWYQGTVDDVSDSELNKYEIANRDLIIKYEKKKKWN